MNLQPFKILQEAIRAVPAVKYALGVAGVVSVVAIVSAFGISPLVAVLGAVITLILMVALVVFAKLTTTARKHFLVPVMVLMWSFLGLTIATAFLLFSTMFFKWPAALPDLIRPPTNSVAVVTQPIGDLLKAANMQRESGDYEASWKSLQQALSLQPNSHEVRQQQVQLAMTWLRNIRLKKPGTFTEVVDQIVPCLYEEAAQAKGTLAADIYAHIGWANFLKFRDGAQPLEIEAQYRKALTYDTDNPFAHAMWGHWILSQHGKLSEAEPQFGAALKTGREKQYVRGLQISALLWTETFESEIEIIRIGNEMRKNRETLPLETREGIVSEVYWMHDSKSAQRLLSISSLPPAEHLATFLWLTDGMNIEESADRSYLLARLTEAAGDYTKALTLYLSVLSRDTIYEKEIKEGIARCKQNAPQSKTEIQIVLESAKDKDAAVRERAFRSLPKLGAETREILPALISGAKDENRAVQEAACDALIRLGADAVPAIIEMLESKAPSDVANAASLLGKIGAEAATSVPSLVKLLTNKDENVRSAAVEALGEFGAAAKDAVPGLINVLQTDPADDTRQSAAYALGEIGPGAKDAVSALVKMMKNKKDDDDGSRGQMVADALGKIGPAAKDAVPALIEALKDDRVHLPGSAAVALGEIGAAAKAAIPVLVEVMQNMDEDRTYRAATIGKIAQSLADNGDTESIPALKKALRAMEDENLGPKFTGPMREALQTLQEKAKAK